jgi:hypothetical protein
LDDNPTNQYTGTVKSVARKKRNGKKTMVLATTYDHTRYAPLDVSLARM